jgi:extracellular solute-binding protein (family 7)
MLFGPTTGRLPHFQLSSNLCRLDLTNLLRHDLSQAPEGQITGHAGGGLVLTFVNLDKWNALLKAYRSILEEAGLYANNWMIAKYDELNPAALKRLLANGVKLYGFSPAIMEARFNAASCTQRSPRITRVSKRWRIR